MKHNIYKRTDFKCIWVLHYKGKVDQTLQPMLLTFPSVHTLVSRLALQITQGQGERYSE